MGDTLRQEFEAVIGGLELLPDVKTLWEGLREHHSRIANDFAESIGKRSFDERAADFIKAESSIYRIDLIKENKSQKFIGYSISSINEESVGEVDSLFVEAAFRGMQIGDFLMEDALNWMDENNTKKKIISVMAGNDVLGFYEKYGFKARAYILEQVNENYGTPIKRMPEVMADLPCEIGVVAVRKY